MAAFVSGDEAASLETWERAHHEFVARGEAGPAARCAFWLGMVLLDSGQLARGGGWIARAGRLLAESGIDCVESGYLLLPAGIEAAGRGEFDAAAAHFERAAEIGARFDDRDLVTMARHAIGRATIQRGSVADGFALLDEVMAGATSGVTSPMVTGIIYCSVIDACRDVADVRRAAEWTAAMQSWCDGQPEGVPFWGRCMIFRSELMVLRGAWPDALDEAGRACARLVGPPPHQAAGDAFYQEAEIHRLRGESAAAEAAYSRANELGRSPMPGMALLRLAQGNLPAAEAALGPALGEANTPRERAAVLAAQVEIRLASGDLPAAGEAADRLAETASAARSPVLRAAVRHARGAILVAGGEAEAAVTELREATVAWREVDAAYDLARTRVLLGLAYTELGQADAATMEFEAAHRAFVQLGAQPDLDRLAQLTRSAPAAAPAGLTGREVEVLALVATGKTNREIASDLSISEKTIARHVSNIFNKLGVSSRAAATAYAYQHDLT